MNKTKLFLSLLFILLAAGVFLSGFYAAKPHEVPPFPVAYDSQTFSRDSMLYYYEKGLVEDDPQGLFYLAVGYYFWRDGKLPDDIPAPSQGEAEEYLIRSAASDYPPALRLLDYLRYYEDFPYELIHE